MCPLHSTWPTGGIQLHYSINYTRKTYFFPLSRAGFLVGKIKLGKEIKLCVQRNRDIKLPVAFQTGQDFDANKVMNSVVGNGER